MGAAQVLPSGWLAVDDANVEAGRRYGYRLVAAEPSLVIEGSEAWVKLMPRGGIRVHELAQAGSQGLALTVEMGADAAGEADVDVFDVGGRRVAGARGVRLAGGAQRMVLPGTDAVMQGVYWVRVKRGVESVVGRVVVVR